ncbi:MAG: SdrD B-like domain-containing protein [Chloroflexota bacterium]
MTKKFRLAFLLAIILTSIYFTKTGHAQNQVSGMAWLDANLNGQIDDGEPGLGGVAVFGQDETGVSLETTTAEDGTWSLSPFDGQRIFIQFVLPESGDLASFRPSVAGRSLVQTISIGTQSNGINAGFFDPSGFCAANPELAVSRYTAGDPIKASETARADLIESGSVLSFPYNISGSQSDSDYFEPLPLSAWDESGAIWGLAWDDASNKLYQSAVVKRHTGFGPLGIGGIYVTDMSLGERTSSFIDLAAAGIDVGSLPDRNLPSDSEEPSLDSDAYFQAGKIGIGGIDLDSTGETLYAMNLAAKELVVIDTATASVTNQFPIPDLACTNGEARPFAVKASPDDEVFVGAVCSAENEGTSEDLSGHVLKLADGNFETIISFPMASFERGRLTGSFVEGTWLPWTEEWSELDAYPVPILTDIEIDDDGSLILAFSDLTGFITGLQQPNPTDTNDTQLYGRNIGGDIVRVCLSDGSYVLEGNAGCEFNRTEGQGGLEYYIGEQFEPNFEIALGGIAMLPNSGEVVSTVSSPFDYLTGGVRWLDNETGQSRRGYQVTSGNLIYFGGAHGLGDVEVICRPAPVEIGSRIWRDINDSGVYDAGDSALPNVPIELFNVSTNETVASVVSDTNGRFGFSTGRMESSPSYATGIQISSEFDYQLRTPIDQGAIAGLNVIQSEGAVTTAITNDAVLAERRFVVNFRANSNSTDLAELDFGLILESQNQTAEGEDALQPGSNVVGAQDPQLAEETSGPRTVLGVPLDFNNRLFLAVFGLIGLGIVSILIGSIGMIWTWARIRRHRAQSQQSLTE